MKKSLLEKIAVFYLVALLLAPMLIALAYSPKNATGFFYSAMNCLVYIAIVSLIATSGFLALFTILISPIILFWSGFLILFECAPHATIFINLLRTPQHEIFNWLVGHFLITIGTFSLFLIAAIAAYLTGLTGKTKLSIRRVHEYALLSTALILSGLMIYFDVQSSKSGYRESDHWSAVFAPPNPTLLTQLNDTLWPLGAARMAFLELTEKSWRSLESGDPNLALSRPVKNKLENIHPVKNGLTVVLLIGESQRADWMSPSHQEKLLPSLHQRWRNGNLLELEQMWSVANFTIYAVPAIMTGTAPDQLTEGLRGRPSGLGYLQTTGFYTSYISNQIGMQFAEAGWDHYQIADETPLFDDYLVDSLKRQLVTSPNKRALAFQMMGSHFDYPDRFPAAFKNDSRALAAQAASKDKPANESARIAAYLTSIAYSDLVISKMLDQLDQLTEPAILIYCSDHGENLYDDERKYYWHGSYVRAGLPELRPAAFVSWNKAYAQEYGNELHALQALQKTTLQQQNLLPVWLYLAGFRVAAFSQDGIDPFAANWHAPEEQELGFYINRRYTKKSALDWPERNALLSLSK